MCSKSTADIDSLLGKQKQKSEEIIEEESLNMQRNTAPVSNRLSSKREEKDSSSHKGRTIMEDHQRVKGEEVNTISLRCPLCLYKLLPFGLNQYQDIIYLCSNPSKCVFPLSERNLREYMSKVEDKVQAQLRIKQILEQRCINGREMICGCEVEGEKIYDEDEDIKYINYINSPKNTYTLNVLGKRRREEVEDESSILDVERKRFRSENEYLDVSTQEIEYIHPDWLLDQGEEFNSSIDIFHENVDIMFGS